MKHLMVTVVVAALLTTACGSDSAVPTAATSASPTTTAITVTVTDPLPIGTSTQASAQATLSNGQTSTVATGFLSDTPSVATVTTGGLVTAVSRGAANIYVISDSRQGTKALRVIANYQGNWSGRYLVTGCNHAGLFASINGCAQIGVGSTLAVGLGFTQSSETVTGRVTYGSVNSETTSIPMGNDGSLTFVARVAGDPQIDVNMSLITNAANQITGTMLQNWRSLQVFGTMQVAGTISGALVKTASVPLGTAAMPPAGADRRIRALISR